MQAGEGQVWGAGLCEGAREGTQNLKGPETLHSWPRAPWVDPRDGAPGREPFPPQGQPLRLLLQPPALGPTWCALDLDPRMEGHGGGPSVDPAGEVLWVLLETSRGDGEEQSALAGTWKELM